MPYTEPELIQTITRMVQLYAHSYPEDRELVERFLAWVLAQWGYQGGQS
jgi:hypothetical protein